MRIIVKEAQAVTHDDSGLNFVTKACISINAIIVPNTVRVVSLSCVKK